MRDEDGDVHAVTNRTKDRLKDVPEHKDLRSRPTNIAELATDCSEGQKQQQTAWGGEASFPIKERLTHSSGVSWLE